MNSIKVGMIGNGWRAQAFLRIIRALPEVFTLQGSYFRNPEKAAAFEKEWPGKSFTDLDLFLEQDFDFVLLSVPNQVIPDYCEKLFPRNIPILCETPPSGNLEGLNRVWEVTQRLHGKIQIAEQYFLQPYHASVLKLIEEGTLGAINSMKISMIHDYHGLSIVRKILSAGFQKVTVSAKAFAQPVAVTCGRSGMQNGEKLTTDHRKTAVFEFEDGKICLFDFSNEQYFNYFRSRHLSVQGTHGELCDNDVCYLKDGYPVPTRLERIDTGLYSNLEGYFHRGIMFEGKFLYRNPFEAYLPRLNDDELAMASEMFRMKEYVDTGVPFYPLEEALQDTYLGFLMDESIKTGAPVTSEKQVWYPKD